MSGFVELAGCNAESTHKKQNHTQDRKNTRGSYSPCKQRKPEGWGKIREGEDDSKCGRQGEKGRHAVGGGGGIKE